MAPSTSVANQDERIAMLEGEAVLFLGCNLMVKNRLKQDNFKTDSYYRLEQYKNRIWEQEKAKRKIEAAKKSNTEQRLKHQQKLEAEHKLETEQMIEPELMMETEQKLEAEQIIETKQKLKKEQKSDDKQKLKAKKRVKLEQNLEAEQMANTEKEKKTKRNVSKEKKTEKGEKKDTDKVKKPRPNFPEAAREILVGWLEEHKDHPYPTLKEKHMLVQKTNLTLLQVNYWFINGRRRELLRILEKQKKDTAKEAAAAANAALLPTPMEVVDLDN